MKIKNLFFSSWIVVVLSNSNMPMFGQTFSNTNLLEGPNGGSDSVIWSISPSIYWNALTTAYWMHLDPVYEYLSGSTNIVFNFNANYGATRSDVIRVYLKSLAVTQAGVSYVPVPAMLSSIVSSGLNYPTGMAADSAGNIYIVDSYNNMIKKWTATNNVVTTLVSYGLKVPYGVAVDSAGNVYIADTGNSAIKKWTATNNIVTTLVSSGLALPYGVAVDDCGNVYIADSQNNSIKEWTVTNNTVTTLVSSGLSYPAGIAVDVVGNVYIADGNNNAIKEWIAASNTVTTLVSSGLNYPLGVAVDWAGNVYIDDYGNNTIKKWTANNDTVASLASSGLNSPQGIAVDSAGNIYIPDTGNNSIKELPRAFVDPTIKVESLSAGNDSLPAVLPTTANLLPPFTPTSDQPWLTITSVTNGVVNFSFGEATSTRTANITVLGESVPVMQISPIFSVGATNLLEGPNMGNDSVVLGVNPGPASWVATANTSWLHLDPAFQAGNGSTNLVFSFDANLGATRCGTITVAGQILTITQTASTYVSIPATLTPLVSLGLDNPQGLAVDGHGNVYIANTYSNEVDKWSPINNTTTVLVRDLYTPVGVAVNNAGNVYIAEFDSAGISEWSSDGDMLTNLFSLLTYPYTTGVAVDSSGNVYRSGNLIVNGEEVEGINEWVVTNNAFTVLASSGFNGPSGVAIDCAGNVYVSDYYNRAIKKWDPANNMVSTLISSGLNLPSGVAVNGSGNIYIADYGSVEKWVAANNTVTTIFSSPASGVAVDGEGNIYIADSYHNAIKELPRAFIDPTSRIESSAAGIDTLPSVLPATENLLPPFAPTSDQSWLTITGITNGVVSFAFSATTSNRVANVTLFGQNIAIKQAIAITPPILTSWGMLDAGVFQFTFTNNPNATYTVLSTTNLALPVANWTVAGIATNISANLFQFTSQLSTNDQQRFYRVSSP